MYQYDIWHISLYVGDRLVCRYGRKIHICIPDGHLQRVTYARCHIDTIDSPDDEHIVARNMYGKELCVKLVIYKNYTEIHRQQDVMLTSVLRRFQLLCFVGYNIRFRNLISRSYGPHQFITVPTNAYHLLPTLSQMNSLH